jgi:hypothetical protein
VISPAIDAVVSAIALNPVTSGLTEKAVIANISQKPIVPRTTVDRYRSVEETRGCQIDDVVSESAIDLRYIDQAWSVDIRCIQIDQIRVRRTIDRVNIAGITPGVRTSNALYLELSPRSRSAGCSRIHERIDLERPGPT